MGDGQLPVAHSHCADMFHAETCTHSDASRPMKVRVLFLPLLEWQTRPWSYAAASRKF